MLILNIILFTSAICSATNVATSTGTSVTSATSPKLKRVVVDPGHNIRNNQEQSRATQTTPRIPSPQDINSRSSPRYGNAKATDTQTVPYTNPTRGAGSYAYGSVPKRPLSYVSSPIHQIESHRSNLLAPYFGISNNPDAYKAARSAEKPLDASKSIVSLQKLQGIYPPSYNEYSQEKPIELSDFSDFSEYPSYTSISKLISQARNSASSPTIPVPVYKMDYPLSKVTDYAHLYAPSMSTVPSTLSSDKTTQSSEQKDEATIDVNGKKISVPIIQLQSNLDFSEVLPVFESQPFLLSANYPIESDVGFKFGTGPKFNMALQSRNISPFSSPLSSFQGQVVPIQTANGSPQFPQYKGASIEAYPVPSNVPKVRGNYESLYSQPQLHFGKEHDGNVQPVNVRQNTVHLPISTQGILNDVEIINKKNPQPHTPQPDDDDDDDDDDDEDTEDERYKSPDKEDEHNSENDNVEHQPGKYFKEPPTESDFKPSTSYPFKEYDETFGKHRTQIDDDDSEDKPYSSYKNYSSSDDDEEEEDPSEYRGEYTESSKPSHDSYEEEDEEEEEKEESRKQERHEETDQDEVKPKRSKYYQKDFEQEFEESYREELPKHEYVHVKEVPEIDSYLPRPSRRQQKNNNQSRVNHGQSEESRYQESRTSRKNRKIPKTGYRDSTAYGSDITVKRAPKVIYEEVFGYSNSGTGKYSKHAKPEKFSPAKKTPTEDSYLHAAKYYKFKSPKTSGLTFKDKDPHSSANNGRLNKISSTLTVARSNVRQLSDPGDGASFYGPSIVSGQVRSLTNAEILRDLTGI